MSQVHFEIFRLQGRGGNWTMAQALPDRDAAIQSARQLLADGQAAAVRVFKETFQPESGDYVSLKILEEGTIEVKRKKNSKIEELEIQSPCFKPDDLYTYHARMTMARVIGEWLARQKLTIVEFLHSAAALEKFEATGTTYQHAIQKVAVAQAADSDGSVTELMKQLDGLCTAAINRIYKDEKRGAFPLTAQGKFGALAVRLAEGPDSRYFLNGALAKYLADAKTWNAKLQNLLLLMKDLPPDGPGRTLLLTSIDSIVAEMLGGSTALADLLGHNPDLGHALLNLVDLFLGSHITLAEGTGPGINDLANYFAKDHLPEARAAIAARIMTELKGTKRLCASSLDDELKMLRRLGNQLVRGQGKYLSNEDLIGAFTERSSRLVSHETLHQFLADATTPDVKVEKLLTMEENIVGVENKRNLSKPLIAIIAPNNFEEQIGAALPPIQRLRRLNELQVRALRSGFQDVQKSQIVAALDGAAVRIEKRANFLAAIESRITNPSERALMLLKLFASGAFTKGDMTAKARKLLVASMTKPGFLKFYVAQLELERKAKIEPQAVVTELASQLQGIGIAPEDTRRALAA